MAILKFDGWRVEGKAQRPLKDDPQHFFLNMGQVVSVDQATYRLTQAQADALPHEPPDPPRPEGECAGYVLRMVDGAAYFVVETEAQMSTRLITLASP